MANEFIARKGLISLGDSQITGSLETTSNLNIEGSGSFGNNKFLIGSNVPSNASSGFNSTWEFTNTGNTSQILLRPAGNQSGFNSAYWGAIQNTGYTVQLLAGNYTQLQFGKRPGSSPTIWARLNNDGFSIGGSTNATQKLDVRGNIKSSGFVTASGNLITEANITASGHVSASTYYGDGSNLTSLPTQDPFPYTGSAIISGSLDVEGDTYIDGFITASDTIWSQNAGGIAFKLNGGAAVRNTGRFYLDAHDQFTIRPDLDGGGNKFVTIVGDLLLSNDTNGVPQDRLHVDGGTVITGSNSLAGNYALKVTNTSGNNTFVIGNDGNIGVNTTPSTAYTFYINDGAATSNTLFVNSYNRIGWNGGARQWIEGWSARIAFKGGQEGEFARFSGAGGVNRLNVARAIQLSSAGGDTGDTRFTRLDTGTVAIGNSADDASGTLYVGNLGVGNTTGSLTHALEVTGNVSASTYYGDGSNLTGIAGISFNGSTANGLVTYGSATTANVEANLTFDGSTFELQGASNFNIQASAFNFNGVPTGTDNTVLVLNSSDNIVTDEIDSRVWGTSLVDSSGFTMEGDIDMDGQTISMNGGEITNGNDIGTARLLAGNGSAGSPSISFTNDTNTGIFLSNPDNMSLQAGGGTTELLINTSGVTVSNGTLAIPGISDVSASIAAASGGGGSAYHTWIGGRGQNTSQATYGTQWRGGMSGNALGGSFVVNADSTLLTVSSGTPSVGDTISANNYKIVTTLIHPAMAFTTIDWYGHFRAYNSACDGNEQHMEIWTLDDVNDLVGFGTTTLTFRGGNQWTYDGTSATIKPIITSGSISHTGTETTAFVVVSHVPTNPASSMQFVYKFDFTVT